MRHSTTVSLAVAAVAAALTCSAPAIAASTVEVLQNYSPTRAPIPGMPGQFYYVSPSFDAYRTNVMQGLLLGLDAFGPVGSPTRFEAFNKSVFSIYETTSTPFNSWLGDITPEGPYAGEYGTFVRAALRVESDQAFTLSNVLYTYIDDIGNNISRTFAAAGFRFGPTLFGLTAGGDLLDNVADDPTQAIVGLYYLGFANINVIGRITPADFIASGQTPRQFFHGINELYVDDPYSFADSYFLVLDGEVVASDALAGDIVETPAPSTAVMALFGLGLLSATMRRRARERRPTA